MIALIAAMAAVASVIIGPFISLLVARRQIRASLVSGNRQAWINALRDDLSELFGLIQWLYLLRPGTYSGADGYKFVDEKRSRIRELKVRIRLRLNPSEPDNIVLLQNIERVDGASPDEFNERMAVAVDLSQSILKREWDRVKRGR